MSVSFSSNQSNYQNNKYTTPLYGNCSILLPKNQENSENWYFQKLLFIPDSSGTLLHNQDTHPKVLGVT